MDIYKVLLAVHIVAGTICLVSGLVAIAAGKRRGVHTLTGEIYHGGYIIIFATSVAMAVMKWSEIAFLFYIALFSYGNALYGYLARKKRLKGWLPRHIAGMLGSYIGIITAVLVVNGNTVHAWTGLPPLLLWFLPTVVGSPLIAMTIRNHQKMRKVKTP